MLNLDVSLATFTNAGPGGVRRSGHFGNGFLLLQALLCLSGEVVLEGFENFVLLLVGDRGKEGVQVVIGASLLFGFARLIAAFLVGVFRG